MDSDTRDGPPRALLLAGILVAVGAVLAVLIVVAVRQESPGQAPLPIATVPAPQGESPDCTTLLDALPDRLGDYTRAPAAQPAPPGAAGWRAPDGGEPVILRCGLDRPVDFVAGAPVQQVDAVAWFRVGEAGAGGDDGRSTWYTVDRPVYVALTLPGGSGPTPIQLVSAAVAKTLPARPPDPGPAR